MHRKFARPSSPPLSDLARSVCRKGIILLVELFLQRTSSPWKSPRAVRCKFGEQISQRFPVPVPASRWRGGAFRTHRAPIPPSQLRRPVFVVGADRPPVKTGQHALSRNLPGQTIIHRRFADSLAPQSAAPSGVLSAAWGHPRWAISRSADFADALPSLPGYLPELDARFARNPPLLHPTHWRDQLRYIPAPFALSAARRRPLDL